MRRRMIFGLLLMTSVIGPASAQQAERGGIRTETEGRMAGETLGVSSRWCHEPMPHPAT